jgi:hypothetical protein
VNVSIEEWVSKILPSFHKIPVLPGKDRTLLEDGEAVVLIGKINCLNIYF